MRRFLGLLLAGLIGLMPLLGTATVSVSADAQEMPCHSENAAASSDAPSSSCTDMKGCCAAVLFSPAAQVRSPVALDERVLPGADLVARFVPDPADRPPVFA